MKQLVIATPKGYKPMPSEWVYMTDKQKDEWLDEHGADTNNVELFIKEVA